MIKTIVLFNMNIDEQKRDIDTSDMSVDVESHIALSEVPTEQLLQLFGRLIGKCLYDDYQIPVPFSNVVAKHLLVSGPDCRNVTSMSAAIFTLEDMHKLDEEVHRSLAWLLDNDVNDLGMTFSVTQNGVDVNLCKDGSAIDVTERNKLEFIRLKILWHVVYSVHTHLFPFLKVKILRVIRSVLCNLGLQRYDSTCYIGKTILQSVTIPRIADWSTNHIDRKVESLYNISG